MGSVGLDELGAPVTSRRLGGAGIRRNLRGSPGGAPSLEAQIIAQYAAAGWDVPFLFLARASDVTLVSTKVSAWANLGSGSDATQSTDAKRPVWDTSAVNSKPGIDCTAAGTVGLLTGDVDLTAYSAFALSILFLDTGSALADVSEYGGAQVMRLRVNGAAAGSVDAICFGSAGTTKAESAGSYPMTSPAVVSGTWDVALPTNEPEIRHAGVNVTSTRSVNSNNATAFSAAYPLGVGFRTTGSGGAPSKIAALCLAAGSTAIPTTQLAAVEALLAAEWGV